MSRQVCRKSTNNTVINRSKINNLIKAQQPSMMINQATQLRRQLDRARRFHQKHVTEDFPLYDYTGRYLLNNLDVCDCSMSQCEGCFFECLSCGSTKCGPSCRISRKFKYHEPQEFG